jgi:succinate dehydrogenase/fumarate reductase flavoprotein subunit
MSSANKVSPTNPRKLKDVVNWDITTDVAVVGFGGAGACAALEANAAGADVCIFELASTYGGSTALSSAEIYMGGSGGTRVQQACGYTDDSEDMYTYMMMAGGAQSDANKVRAYVDGSAAHFDWLVDHGVPYKNSEYKERAIMAMTDDCILYTGSEKAWPYVEAAKPCPRGHNIEVDGDNGGPLLMKILNSTVTERENLDVYYDTRVIGLIKDDDNVVHGLVIRKDQEELNVKTSQGVILCAGGFVMNDDMLQKYAPTLFKANTKLGNPGDTGAGIQMGMSVGGAAINMHEGFVTMPYYPPASLTKGILINAQGQRFINEDCYHGRVGHHVLQQQGERVYLIFNADDFGEYQEVSYLNADIAGTGDTISELEQELDFVSGSLQQTIEFYNSHAAQGNDPKFHKSEEWLCPIEPPYAALDCTPGRGAFFPYFTLGGLDTKPSGEVVDPDGNIVQGLYAAGRTTAGICRTGSGYSSGMSVGDATYFGRMAGISAAAVSKRE